MNDLLLILASIALPLAATVAAVYAAERAQRQALADWWNAPEGERDILIVQTTRRWQVAALVGSLSLVWLVAVAANV